jgi:lipid-A-disaccharide synthase
VSASPTVFLSAGEQSGDLHGAELARELRQVLPDVRLAGLGGSRMELEGVELLAGLDRLAVLGFAEVVRRLPDFLRLRRQVRRFLIDEGVDLFVPIDYPGFNLPMACAARRSGIHVLYYIAPQVWAWKKRRAYRLARCAEKVCVVLPFEAEFLSAFGVNAEFVGHPLLDRHDENGSSPSPIKPTDLEAGVAPVLGLFPGSRAQEVERMLPLFLEAAELVRRDVPDVDVLVARSADLPYSVFGDVPGARLETPELVMARATAALTKSGTITLQLALAGVPMVVGYRTSAMTYLIARRLVRVPHIALANLVADRRVVPELIQDELTARAAAAELRPLLDRLDGARTEMVGGLGSIQSALGSPGCARRVAEACAALLSEPGS